MDIDYYVNILENYISVIKRKKNIDDFIEKLKSILKMTQEN